MESVWSCYEDLVWRLYGLGYVMLSYVGMEFVWTCYVMLRCVTLRYVMLCYLVWSLHGLSMDMEFIWVLYGFGMGLVMGVVRGLVWLLYGFCAGFGMVFVWGLCAV